MKEGVRDFCPKCNKRLSLDEIYIKDGAPCCSHHGEPLAYSSFVQGENLVVNSEYGQEIIPKPESVKISSGGKKRYYISFWFNYFDANSGKWKGKSLVRFALKNAEGKELEITKLLDEFTHKLEEIGLVIKKGKIKEGV